MMTETIEKPTANRAKTWRAVVLGAAAGFLGMMGMMELIDAGTLGDLEGSQVAALSVALIFLLTCAAVGFGLAAPKTGAKFLNAEDAEELREQRTMLTYSLLGMLASAVILIVAALSGSGGIIAATPALVIVVIALTMLVWTSVRTYAHSDELMRATSRASGATAFYLTGAIGGGWELLAHLGLAAGPQSLDWITMLASFMLLAVYIEAGRRGMMTMR